MLGIEPEPGGQGPLRPQVYGPTSPAGPHALLQRLWACLQSHRPYLNPQAEKERGSLLEAKKGVPASDTASQEPCVGACPLLPQRPVELGSEVPAPPLILQASVWVERRRAGPL